MVPVEKIREIAEKKHRDGMSWTDMAKKLGWTTTHGDSSRLKKVLGIQPFISHGRRKHREYVLPRTAKAICEVLGIDFTDVDL